ncbi:MAG: formylglycine-generating enzyme family protein [Nitrospiria bacterium]
MSLKKSLVLFFLLFIPIEYTIISLSRKVVPPEMRLVPAGEFIMGSNEVDLEETQKELGNKKPFYLDEHPQHRVNLPDFLIDLTEVTNRAYADFIKTRMRNPPPAWKGGDFPSGQGTLPVVEVNWYEARDYCRSIGKRLPTEEEWEKAARGPSGNMFVWGNKFDPMKANVSAGSHGGATMVGRWSSDRSFYGIYDMNGNVMEWVDDWYQPYPDGDYESPDFGEQFKVAKGDAYGESGHYAMTIFSRLPYRQNVLPETRFPFLGFRCAKDW